MTKAKKGKKRSAKSTKAKPSSITSKAFIFNKKLQLLSIFLLSCLLYANTLGHQYTQDDAIVIYDNEFTTQGLAGIPDILSKDTFHGFFGQKKNLVAGGRYRPLSLVLFAVEWQLFPDNPFIGHLFNIFWYGLTAIVLYLLLLYILNPSGKTESMFPWFVAFVATVLFVVHPTHTEAVANIKGRDEILALLGSLAAMYFLFRYYYEHDNKFLLYSALCFFLGLLSKENTITFLGIIPVTFYFFTKAKPQKILGLTAPLFGAALVFIAIRTAIIGLDMGESSQELMNNPYVDMTGGEKMATIMFTLGKYIQLLIAPITLTHDYYPYHVGKMNWGNWEVLLSLFLYIGLIGYAIYAFIKKDRRGYGVIFFLLSLSIVSNVVFAIGTNMSERFLFMPSIGFTFLVALLLYELGKRMRGDLPLKTLKDLGVAMAVFGFLFTAYSFKTITRNTAWKDNYTLFLTDVATSKNSAKLQNAVGGEMIAKALEEKNEVLKSLADIKNPNQKKAKEAEMDRAFEPKIVKAIEHLQAAVKIHPTYSNPYLQLGNAHNYLKKYEEAFGYFKKSLSYKENSKEALNNLGITYRDAANHIGNKQQRQRFSQALSYFQESISYFERLKPFTRDQEQLRKNKAQTYRDWGKFYGERLQNFDEALKYLNKGLEFDKEDNEIYRLIGLCYASKGQTNEAIRLFEDLVAKQPKNANILYNLGAFYSQTGNPQKGKELVNKALKIDPNVGQN